MAVRIFAENKVHVQKLVNLRQNKQAKKNLTYSTVGNQTTMMTNQVRHHFSVENGKEHRLKMIAENLTNINNQLQLACRGSQHSVIDVTMIGIIKSIGIEEAVELVQLGVQNSAENRVDRLLEKKAGLGKPNDIQWHLIGNLQRRKVKLIINEIDYFHVLDSLSLAGGIQKRATKVVRCFVEVNIIGEESRHDSRKEDVLPFIQELAGSDKIQIVGLMTMVPFGVSEEVLYATSRELKELQMIINERHLSSAPYTELNMGMSNDSPIAAGEGITFI